MRTYFENGRGETLNTKYDHRNGIRFVFSTHLKNATVELRSAGLQLSVDNNKAKVSATKLRYQRHVLLRT